MAVNKVVYGDEVKIDLTGDTVTAENLKKGITAHDKSGEIITGTNEMMLILLMQQRQWQRF